MEILATKEPNKKRKKDIDRQKGKVTGIRSFFEAKGRAPGPPLDRKSVSEKGSGPKTGDSAAEAGSGGGKY